MINFFSYFPIFFSLSFSFLLHAIFNFKIHIDSFFGHTTTTSNSNNNTNDNELHHHSISSTANDSMACTKIIERIVNVDYQIDDSEDINDECWRTEERRGNWKEEEKSFPRQLSSLDGNGQPSFILLPVKKNGRLQLNKVRIKRPEIIHATRQDGRLRLYLVPDECLLDDGVEQREFEEEEVVEVESEEEGEMFEDEITRYEYEEEDDRVREWKRGDNERFRRCNELVNHIHCINHVHSQHNLHMFGIGIA